jgi:hypothetical protein
MSAILNFSEKAPNLDETDRKELFRWMHLGVLEKILWKIASDGCGNAWKISCCHSRSQ